MTTAPIALMEDSPPYLDFEITAVEDRGKSIEKGRKIYFDVEQVFITPMGDNKTQVIKACDEWLSHLKERLHHGMISEKYYEFCNDSYKAWKNKRAAPVIGTPIEEWPQVTKSQVKMILDANIRTIEDLAAAPDEALGLIGMGSRDLKRKAEIYLKSATDHGVISEQVSSLESQVEAAKAEKEEMLQRLADLEAKLAEEPVVKKKDAA